MSVWITSKQVKTCSLPEKNKISPNFLFNLQGLFEDRLLATTGLGTPGTHSQIDGYDVTQRAEGPNLVFGATHE